MGEPMAKKVYEEVTTKQTMNRVKAPRMPFDWSINPYRGCSHGCSFCYARSTHSFLGMKADDSFQNHILVKSNAAEALEAQLSHLAKRFQGDLRQVSQYVGLVALGTATDPYQPVEAKTMITRECLKVLRKYRIRTSITTRSPLILRDLDLLQGMRITSINISVNTLDSEICRSVEPATPMPMKRLKTVQELVENGLPAGIFLAPILPFLTDSMSDLEQLIAAAKQHKARFVMPSVLRLTPEVKQWYFSTLQQTYPQLLPAYRKLYPGAYPGSHYVHPLMQRIGALMAQYGLSTDIEPDREENDEPSTELEEVAASTASSSQENGWEQLSFAF
jgi:DNA repair photolyase